MSNTPNPTPKPTATPDLHNTGDSEGGQFGAVVKRIGEGAAAGVVATGVVAAGGALVRKFASGASKTSDEAVRGATGNGGGNFSGF